MSQSGILRTTAGVLPPSVPTSFVTNSGTAIPVANILNVLGSTVAAGSNPFRSIGSGNTVTYQTQISQAIAGTDATKIGLAAFNSSVFTVDANGFVGLVSGGLDLHTARFIVSAGGAANGANYTTIASAITAAVAAGGNQTIFIQPGTYTENLTLAANINLTAYSSDAFTPNVIILGKITASYSGSASISGICLRTNSDNILLFSSANLTKLTLTNCYLDITNNTGFSLTNSNSSSFLLLNYCLGDIGTTGIALFASTMTGTFDFNWCKFTNSGNSTIASTSSAGSFFTRASSYNNVFTFSSTGGCDFNNSIVFTDGINTTPLNITASGGGGNNLYQSRFSGGTASAINYSNTNGGQNTNLSHCIIFSSNANAITGTGFFMYAFLSFTGSSSTVNGTLTATPLATLI